MNEQTSTSAPVSTSLTRLASLDALRGLIMVAMALDHANYFIARQHTASEFWFLVPQRYGTDLAFLTRLVTHLAAPGFFFLMGTGMALFADSRRRAGWKEGAIRRHLAIRGLLLIALQLLVENRAWPIAIPSGAHISFTLYFGVLYGLGGVLLFGSLLIGLNWRVLVPLGLGLVAVSNLFLSDPSAGDSINPLRALFLTAGVNGDFMVYYPILPWLGVALLGVVFGQLLLSGREGRGPKRDWLLLAAPFGALLLVLFVVLRNLKIGDPHPPIDTTWQALLSVTKYPPSPDFLLMTLGTDLLLLGALTFVLKGGRAARIVLHPLLTFGRAPLFFYLAHLFLYAVLGVIFAPDGTTLEAMYPLWLLGLLILYPLCWAYGKFKASRPPDSIWRFF